jgi:hypothetical protein
MEVDAMEDAVEPRRRSWESCMSEARMLLCMESIVEARPPSSAVLLLRAMGGIDIGAAGRVDGMLAGAVGPAAFMLER